MVTDRYLRLEHHPEVTGLVDWAACRGLPRVGIDNVPGSVPLETAVLPRECVLVCGQEGPGLADAARAACQPILHISQYGSTRSINAGAAAAVALHTWIRQHAVPQR
jgi:tRNA G18 (ribose-2'-O)-methylase SpoU